MPTPTPMNCEAKDDLQQVDFDLVFEGATWKCCISYETLTTLFAGPGPNATLEEARESRRQLVFHSKEISRIAAELVRAGAQDASRIAISPSHLRRAKR